MNETRSNRDPFEVLVDRLTALERSNRRLRAGFFALALLVAALATGGAAALVPDTMAAHSFRLVDAGGAERAALTSGDHGTAVLTLNTGGGESALTITLAPVAPFVVVADKAGKAVAPPASVSPQQPAAEKPAKRSRIEWGKPPPSDGKKEDDSFDWAD